MLYTLTTTFDDKQILLNKKIHEVPFSEVSII